MCPLCIATITVVVTGAISSSAAGAFALTKIFRQTANNAKSKTTKYRRAHEESRQEP